MKASIYALAAAAFAVVTTEFSIVGILPAVAQSLNVSISQAGLLVTLFAVVVAVSGPFLTAFATRFERRKLFVSLLLVMAVGNVIGAVAETFEVMLIARLLPAFALPVFWSIASSSAASVAGEDQAGKAISTVFYGVSAATVLGVPLGALIADAFDWRTTFISVGGLCVIMALVLQSVFPRIEGDAPSDGPSAWTVLKSRTVIGHLLLSGAVFTALFTSYTYLADLLQSLGSFNGNQTGWILMAFGAVGLLGNWAAGQKVDAYPKSTSVVGAALAALGMASVVEVIHVPLLMAIALIVWGIAQSASFVANHVRVIKAVPEAPELAASLNVSVCNVGIGLGAVIGGGVIDTVGLDFVGLAGGGIILVALAATLGAYVLSAGSAKPQIAQEA